jgi:hypothetical protein
VIGKKRKPVVEEEFKINKMPKSKTKTKEK